MGSSLCLFVSFRGVRFLVVVTKGGKAIDQKTSLADKGLTETDWPFGLFWKGHAMTTKKNTPVAATAIERFIVTPEAIATAQAEVDAPNVVIEAKAALMTLFRAHKIEAFHFGAPALASEKADNEWVAARDWLWRLAAPVVTVEGVKLDAEGVAAVFNPALTNAALICGKKKGDWKNRINNQVGTKWGKNVFGATLVAEEKAAAKAAAEAAGPAPEPTAEEKQAALTKENQAWFEDKLQVLFNRSFKEIGGMVDGDIATIQNAIRTIAKEVGGVKLTTPQ